METRLGWHLTHFGTGQVMRSVLLAAAFSVFAQTNDAAEPLTIKLWEHGAPGTPATKPKDEPVLLMTAPAANPTSTGAIILPGGGYAFLAMDHEGKQAAEWLNSIGVTAFVLKY